MPGAQQAGVIFEKSDKQQQAWEFLSWWTSKEIQAEYASIKTLRANEALLKLVSEHKTNPTELSGGSKPPQPGEF